MAKKTAKVATEPSAVESAVTPSTNMPEHKTAVGSHGDKTEVQTAEGSEIAETPKGFDAPVEPIRPLPLTQKVIERVPIDPSLERVCRDAPEGSVICVTSESDHSRAVGLLNALGKSLPVSVRESQPVKALWRMRGNQ